MAAGRVQGGFNQYGFTVGILMLDTRFPRIPGDMGNATTFPFPVRYHRVPGADPDLVVRRGAEGMLPAFVEGARALEREGVGAITTNCGFLVKYQSQRRRCPSRADVSLLLLASRASDAPPGRRVGIRRSTPSARTSTCRRRHRRRPLAVAGLEGRRSSPGLLGTRRLDVDQAARHCGRRRLVAEHPDVGAIVLECTNMPPYTADIQRETGLPVFDIVSLVTMVHGALVAAGGPRPASGP
jgi:hypothetical protein